MPIILAIETSSELASCALLRGDTVLARSSSGVRTHSQSVLPMIQELLAEAGIALRDCDAIAFGSGPGSFTGVRTACGIAQGLAFGANLPVVPVVTLDAMALACWQQHGGSGGTADVLAVLDARMGEVYWAQYQFDTAARGATGSAVTAAPRLVLAPALSAPDAIAPQGAVTACGNGFAAYAEALAGKDCAAGAHADVMPHATQIAQLAAIAYAAGATVSAAEAQPLYLRNKIAYTQSERREIAATAAAAAAATAAAAKAAEAGA